MTHHRDVFAGYEELAARFRPVFARIAEGSRAREQSRTPPREQLQWLIDAGFAALRVPREHGGEGIALAQILRLISELAEADENLAHIWRNHISFIADRRHDPKDPRSGLWLRRLGAGQIVGGGWSEPGAAGVVDTQTVVFEEDGERLLTGRKLYATGSIYATWATVLAIDPEGEKVVVLVDTTSPGVRIADDWDGFGQRLTGSGTVEYDRVRQVDTVAETDDPVDADLERSWLETAITQVTAAETVLNAATRILDVLGSSGTSARYALDRHWRNARTIASHNPRLYKSRIIGNWYVNGVDPTVR